MSELGCEPFYPEVHNQQTASPFVIANGAGQSDCSEYAYQCGIAICWTGVVSNVRPLRSTLAGDAARILLLP
jgi:hypothetical protein